MQSSETEIDALKEEVKNLKAQLSEADKLMDKAVEMKQMIKTLRRNFQGMVQLLTETVSLDNRFLGGHLKRTAELTKAFCEYLKLPKDIVYVNYYAALLHDIGLVGSDPELIEKTYNNLNSRNRNVFEEHPVTGSELINSIYNLKRTAVIIRSHHENYDGTGFPDKLASGEIPKESRMIRIINDYDINRFKKTLSPADSIKDMESGSGTLYDPELLAEFQVFVDQFEKNNSGVSRGIEADALQPGMYLNQDIILSNGLLLLPSGVILDKVMIGKIQSFSSMLLGQGVIQVVY